MIWNCNSFDIAALRKYNNFITDSFCNISAALKQSVLYFMWFDLRNARLGGQSFCPSKSNKYRLFHGHELWKQTRIYSWHARQSHKKLIFGSGRWWAHTDQGWTSAPSPNANMRLHYRKQNKLLMDLFAPGAQRQGAQCTTKQQEREKMKTTNKMKQTKAEVFIMCMNYITRWI